MIDRQHRGPTDKQGRNSHESGRVRAAWHEPNTNAASEARTIGTDNSLHRHLDVARYTCAAHSAVRTAVSLATRPNKRLCM